MKSLDAIDNTQFSKVKIIFFDIDDTFSTDGKILPEAYSALWQLFRAGMHVVPVTGRPAGWCDLIARMWPVSAVVGENGAFYCYMSSGSQPRFVKKYLESKQKRKKNQTSLKKLKQKITKIFPHAKFASDQPFREFDIAVDYCEDVHRWEPREIQRLLKFAQMHGAVAKLSSIHVNIWFGNYDKWSCVKHILSHHFSMNLKKLQSQVLYIGDSPNDEVFFKNLSLTVGVANIKKFIKMMQYHPAFITHAKGGLGFAELAQKILNQINENKTN